MSAAEMLEQITELRETIGSNPHPNDFVGEREDLPVLEAQYRAATTESQRNAVDGESGGMFTPASATRSPSPPRRATGCPSRPGPSSPRRALAYRASPWTPRTTSNGPQGRSCGSR